MHVSWSAPAHARKVKRRRISGTLSCDSLPHFPLTEPSARQTWTLPRSCKAGSTQTHRAISPTTDLLISSSSVSFTKHHFPHLCNTPMNKVEPRGKELHAMTALHERLVCWCNHSMTVLGVTRYVLTGSELLRFSWKESSKQQSKKE